MFSASASEVSGPLAMMTSPSGISTASFLNDLHIGKGADGLSHGAGKAFAVHRQRAAGSYAVLIGTAHHDAPSRRSSSLRSPTALVSSSLRSELEHTSSAKYGETCAESFFRLHFDQPHRDAPDGKLISRFGTGKTGSDNRYSVHLSSFGVSFFSVLSAADSCGFSAVLSAAALRR